MGEIDSTEGLAVHYVERGYQTEQGGKTWKTRASNGDGLEGQ